MNVFLELFNYAILIALIIFSAWSFYLQYKADRVTTTKDLLLAYVTGGALAVVTMVFGVTGDIKGMTTNIEEATGTIIETSASIKQDTVSIRTTLGGGIPPTKGPSGTTLDEDLAQLFAVNQQQTQALSRVLGILAELQENSEQTNQHLSIDDDLAELLRINQQNTQAIRQLFGTTNGLGENLKEINSQAQTTNRLLERLLANSGSNQEVTATFSGSQLLFQLDLVCSLRQVSVTVIAPNCVIKSPENVERVQ